jgi:hypothetical protein
LFSSDNMVRFLASASASEVQSFMKLCKGLVRASPPAPVSQPPPVKDKQTEAASTTEAEAAPPAMEVENTVNVATAMVRGALGEDATPAGATPEPLAPLPQNKEHVARAAASKRHAELSAERARVSAERSKRLTQAYRDSGKWTCHVCAWPQEETWRQTCEMCSSNNPFLAKEGGAWVVRTPKKAHLFDRQPITSAEQREDAIREGFEGSNYARTVDAIRASVDKAAPPAVGARQRDSIEHPPSLAVSQELFRSVHQPRQRDSIEHPPSLAVSQELFRSVHDRRPLEVSSSWSASSRDVLSFLRESIAKQGASVSSLTGVELPSAE